METRIEPTAPALLSISLRAASNFTVCTKVENPVTNESPKTWSFDVGLVVPIPTSPLSVTTNILPSIVCPEGGTLPIWNLCSGFVVPMPIREYSSTETFVIPVPKR